MDLELLRTFVAVADASTLTAAATQRRVTKSAISQQLKTLEARMGLSLFERAGRGMRPTAAARTLADALRGAFAMADDAIAAAREAHGEVRGEVKLGAPRPFTQAKLGPAFAQLLSRHPDLLLDVSFGSPTELEAQLGSGALDLAVLVRAPADNTTLEHVAIATERFELVASPKYVERHGEPRSMDDLLDPHRRFIVFDRDLPMHSAWWSATFGSRSSRQGAGVNVIARIASVDAMLALVTSHAGLAVLPDYLIAPAVAARKLSVIRIRGAKRQASNTIYVAQRRSVVATARLHAVREAILSGVAP